MSWEQLTALIVAFGGGSSYFTYLVNKKKLKNTDMQVVINTIYQQIGEQKAEIRSLKEEMKEVKAERDGFYDELLLLKEENMKLTQLNIDLREDNEELREQLKKFMGK